jgi:protein ImuA
MISTPSDILSRLKMDILPLEGLRPPPIGASIDLGLGAINDAFPHKTFPIGAIHEFVNYGFPSAAATAGFISGLLSGLMKGGGAVLWISASRFVFPPALKTFGIEPDRIIFIDRLNERDILWTMEEALKCKGLAAVIGEIPELNFTTSRRFQLAVEQSRVTGFITRMNPRNLITNACVSRWTIKSLPTYSDDGLPGLGFPRWQVDLLKIRNGKPGSWQMEWKPNGFHIITDIVPSIELEQKRKRG